MDEDKNLSGLELIVLALTLLSIVTVGLQFFGNLNIESHKILNWWDWVCSAVFLTEWTVRFCRAENKKKFAFNNSLDFLASTPFWLVTGDNILALSIFRGIKVIGGITRFWSYMEVNKPNIVRMCMAILFVFTLCISPLIILNLEQTTGSINTASNALWWTFCTITTIGYGDLYPVTEGGRLFTVFVSLGGIGAFGIMSSIVLSKVLKTNSEQTKTN